MILHRARSRQPCLMLGLTLFFRDGYADERSEVVVFTERGMAGKDPIVCVANAASQLAPEDIDLLFDRFWRGDAARSGSFHCGLGLPLARACGEVMNWSVHARLRPHDGWLEIRIEPGDNLAG